MNKTHWIGYTVLIGSALIAGAFAFASGQGDRERGVPAFPTDPYKEKVDVVYAQRYQLEPAAARKPVAACRRNV